MKFPVQNEVNQVSAIRRQITLVFINSTFGPLAEFECVSFAVPEEGGELSGGAASNDQTDGGIASEEDMESSRGDVVHGGGWPK